MATTSDFKNGLCLDLDNDLFTIVQFQHVKPGKGPAFVRTKLKSLNTGKVLDKTFSAGVKVNIARVERRPYQFLYSDDLGFHFMHTDNFEQLTLEPSLIDAPELLLEGQPVEIVYHADTETPLACDLPPFVVMRVTYAEPGVRGDTSSTSSLKPATIETGATVNVPLFINEGDKIKVDTRTKTYAERVKD